MPHRHTRDELVARLVRAGELEVSGESQEEHKKHFGAFGGHSTWKKLNGDPQYKDNVSKITRLFLRPTAGSQI